ncbi:MAG: hypothetical protein IKN31_01170 [Bacteroidales bacterium]|nr:hypothetical protein [Bacteroidales bacterium]
MLEDGEIGPRERKHLERSRVRLGINENRAKDIENKSNQDDNYMAEVKIIKDTIADASMRIYGIDVHKTGILSPIYLDVERIG